MDIQGGGIDYSTKFTIFTDGSALNNSQQAPAGMAVYIPSRKILLSKGMIATNNQAELEAIRYALWYFTKRFMNAVIPDKKVYLFTDSEYSMNVIQGKVKAKVNGNKIYVCQQLVKEIENKGLKVVFQHVMAHTKRKDFISVNNDIVDQEARRRAEQMKEDQK